MGVRSSLSDLVVPGGPVGPDLSSGLWTFRRQMAWKLTQTVNVVCVGSSTTFGTGATSQVMNYVARLGYMLNGYDDGRDAGANQFHQRADQSGWTTSGSISTVTGDLGMQAKQLDAAAYMEYGTTCTGFRVMFGQGSGLGSFRLLVDGTEIGTVTPSVLGTERADGEFTNSQLAFTMARGYHSVRVMANGKTYLSGLFFEDGTDNSGVKVYNAGKGGTVSADYAAGSSAAFYSAARMARIGTDLAVVMIGSNDYSSQVSPAQYEANMRQALQIMRLGQNRPMSVLLVHSWKRFDVTAPTYAWAEYGRVLARIAADTPDTDFLDVSPHFPASLADDWDQIMAKDGIHGGDLAQALLARTIADHLLRPFAPRSAPKTAVTAAPAPDPATLPGLVSAWRASDLAVADGAAIGSWPAYAGSDQKTLTQTDPLKQPRMSMPADFRGQKCVDFTADDKDWMECTFTARVNPPATIVMVARLRSNWGASWSGQGTAYLAATASGEFRQVIAAGQVAYPAAYTLWLGRWKWKVYVVRYSGATSAMWQTGYPVQTMPTMVEDANAGLTGLTLSSNLSRSSCQDQAVADMMVFNRALTDTEAANTLRFFERKYGIDQLNRTSV